SKVKTAVWLFAAVALFGSGVAMLGHQAIARQDSGAGNTDPKPAAAAAETKKQTAPTSEGNKAFENATGYEWAVHPKKGRGSPWAISWADKTWADKKSDGASGPSGIVCIEEVDKDGGLVFTIAHPANTTKSGLPNFRPVAFDGEHHRHPLTREHGASAGPVAMYRYHLDPKELPAAKVEYLGIEII